MRNARLVEARPGPPAVVTKISAKTASRNRVSIITTTLMARARWGMMMKKNMENGPAPSMRAASLRSGSSAWMAVSRMSAAKGSHCQATMMMIEARDRKSTRLNSSHVETSYAGFCLKKKNTATTVGGEDCNNHVRKGPVGV